MTTDVAGIPDTQLMVSLVRGDPTALAALYDRYADVVYRAAFRRLGDRQMAEEVVQDTWLALWDHAGSFDPTAGSLIAWLSTIARNRAVDRLRALGRRPGALPLSAVFDTDPGAERVIANSQVLMSDQASRDPQVVLDESGLRATMLEALASIPSEERQVLELAYYGELSQSEIAQRLGWPIGTVKTRTRRALLRLRSVVSGSLGPDGGLDGTDVATLAELAEADDGSR